MKDSLDRILTSVPLDSTAARVTSKGTHWEATLKAAPEIIHQDFPPPMVAVPQAVIDQGNDLRGLRTGRFVVLGLCKCTNPKKPAAWAVRCACGQYETRSAKAIRNVANVDDCCRACRRLKYIKRAYQELGSKSVAEFKPAKP